MDEPKKEQVKRIRPPAGAHRRSILYAEQENKILLEDAKKDSWARFSTLIRKYNIDQEDVEEIMDVSPYLL